MIHIQRADFEELAEKHYLRVRKDITKRLSQYLANGEYLRLKAFYLQLLQVDNLKQLILLKPGQFKDASTRIKPFEADEIKQIIDDFGYSSFRSSEAAYQLAKSLNIEVCPYCNREYTFSMHKSNGEWVLLFDFDHFYPKADFPYFSLSFYNLIPSCPLCNSRLKGKKETTIHPYERGVTQQIEFRVKFRKQEEILEQLILEHIKSNIVSYPSGEVFEQRFILFAKYVIFNKWPASRTNKSWMEEFDLTNSNVNLIKKHRQLIEPALSKIKTQLEKEFGLGFFNGELNSFCIEVQAKNEKELEKEVKDHLKLFHIKEVYNQHKAQAYELFQKSLLYNEDYLASLYGQYSGTLFGSEADVRRLAFGSEPSDEQHENRPLSKFTTDILNQLKP